MAVALSPLQVALLITFGAPGEGIGTVSRVLAWIPIAAALVFGAWLIRKRHTLASRWFGESSTDLTPDSSSLLRLALTVAGIVLVALAIPGLISGILSGVETWGGSSDGGGFETHVSWVWSRALTSSAGPLVELAVGALLVARAARLARRLWGTGGDPANFRAVVAVTGRIESVSTDASEHADDASA